MEPITIEPIELDVQKPGIKIRHFNTLILRVLIFRAFTFILVGYP